MTKTDDQQGLPELTDEQVLLEYPDLFPGLRLICQMNTPREELLANIHSALERNLPQVWPHQPQDTEIGVCCGGPSLNSQFDEMRELVGQGGKLICLANAMHVLTDEGISPSGQILLDAKPRNAEFLRDVPGCTYFIASQCNPAVFERVLGYGGKDQRVFLWHAINNDEELQKIVTTQRAPWVRVTGGSTIALRALQMLKILGYHKFHMFGFDSCYLEGAHHAYPQERADDIVSTEIECNGRLFKVQGWMMNQALEFIKLVRVYGDEMQLRVYGDGLIAHMIKTTRETEAA